MVIDTLTGPTQFKFDSHEPSRGVRSDSMALVPSCTILAGHVCFLFISEHHSDRTTIMGAATVANPYRLEHVSIPWERHYEWKFED